VQDEVSDRVRSLDRVLVRVVHVQVRGVKGLDKLPRRFIGPQHVLAERGQFVSDIEPAILTSQAYPLDTLSKLSSISVVVCRSSKFDG
jgi:hypothetical protein